MNLIFYRPSILPEVIFSDAQVLLDKITELVCCNHALRDDSGNTNAIPPCMQCSEKLNLRDRGKVNSELPKKASPSHYRANLFTSTEFLLLLERFLIASKLENGEYFIPSLLPDLEVEKIAKYRVVSPEQPAPLV